MHSGLKVLNFLILDRWLGIRFVNGWNKVGHGFRQKVNFRKSISGNRENEIETKEKGGFP